MSDLFLKISGRHNLIYKLVLFTCCVGFLVFLFPTEAKFKYVYNEGQAWRYDELYSPFDYAIRKTAEEIAAEEAAIKNNFKPYYQLRDNVATENQRKLRDQITGNWEDCSYSESGLFTFNREQKDSVAITRHVRTAERILDKLYRTGIIQLADEHEDKPSDFEITLIQNKKARDIELGNLRAIKEAYAYAEQKLANADAVDEDFLLEVMSNCLEQNVFYDDEKSKIDLEEQLSTIGKTKGRVQKDEKIISRGDIVDASRIRKLQSLEYEFEKQLGGSKDATLILIGQILIVAICVFALFIFLFLFRKEVLDQNKRILFLLLLISLMALLAKLSQGIEIIDIYLVPLCLLPIVIRAFFDAILALFVHIITVLIISFLAQNQFEFLFLHLIAGVVVIFSIFNLRRRSQFFVSVGLVFLGYTLTYVSLAIIQEGELESIALDRIGWFAGNAVLMLFAFPLIFIFEKLFGFISDITLMELSDTNSPLLRDLTSKAPGTFQHTMQVANLAEEAIREIGGDALLVRTGALYHDIGKMERPMYFIENQSSGINAHDELGYEESARIIIDHVIHGIELAKKYSLPDEIIDFIRTHHGTSRVEYFYRMQVAEVGEENVDEANFRYPGPQPYSKETAVLMMADAVEAASRSLKKYDGESISGLVEGIINSQMNHGQFTNADITLKDITNIKKLFKRKLMNIYHVRIEYPK